MTSTDTEGGWPPGPAEVAELRAPALWLTLAGVSGDADRVADEGGRILRASKPVIGCALGELTRLLSTALVHIHGSRQAAAAAVSAEIAEAFELILADHE